MWSICLKLKGMCKNQLGCDFKFVLWIIGFVTGSDGMKYTSMCMGLNFLVEFFNDLISIRHHWSVSSQLRHMDF